jgi:SAM-dependent methyltransferase
MNSDYSLFTRTASELVAGPLRRLRDSYEELVAASCSEQPFPIPTSVQRHFINAFAFEYVAAVRQFVGDARRILVIGDAGGRDYYSLKLLGKSPTVIDIAPQSIINELVIADANEPLPFAPGSFDAVVMAEVLEHLPKDFDALRHVREAVRDGGTLALTVPYFHDVEPTHVRIHSPASIERLLRATGWQVVEYIEKGGYLAGLMTWFPLRMAFHAANALVFKLWGRTFYQRVNRRIARFDFWVGGRRGSLHRYSRFYGAFIKCAKGNPADVRKENILVFAQMHTQRH